MFEESPITDALIELKYIRLKRLTYRASWSTSDLEHFLYFCLHETPNEFLTADFGLRNAAAEEFGVECIRRYGADLYRILRHDARVDCKMRFSLGKLAAWGPRWALRVPEIPMVSLVEKIKIAVSECLIPITHEVTSLDKLLSLLLEDAEPYPWHRVNGAIRSAQISYVARRLGKGSAEIGAMLQPFEKELVASLGKGGSPTLYLENVIKHSADVCAAKP